MYMCAIYTRTSSIGKPNAAVFATAGAAAAAVIETTHIVPTAIVITRTEEGVFQRPVGSPACISLGRALRSRGNSNSSPAAMVVAATDWLVREPACN